MYRCLVQCAALIGGHTCEDIMRTLNSLYTQNTHKWQFYWLMPRKDKVNFQNAIIKCESHEDDYLCLKQPPNFTKWSKLFNDWHYEVTMPMWSSYVKNKHQHDPCHSHKLPYRFHSLVSKPRARFEFKNDAIYTYIVKYKPFHISKTCPTWLAIYKVRCLITINFFNFNDCYTCIWINISVIRNLSI